MSYEWNSDLESGHTLIDEQHKELFAAVNRFSDAFRNGKGPAEIEKTLRFLVGYTERHFHDEEELQKQYDFWDYSRHKMYHQEFKKAVQELAHRFETEGPTHELLNEIYETVVSWLLHHIKSDDFVLATHIRERAQSKQ